jgi:hypothetical protein
VEDSEGDLKRAFADLDAAWNAHLVRLAAREDALTGLVLALCQRLGLDRVEADRLLAAHEKMIETDRLVKIEDSNPAIAAAAASFLERWEQAQGGSAFDRS